MFNLEMQAAEEPLIPPIRLYVAACQCLFHEPVVHLFRGMLHRPFPVREDQLHVQEQKRTDPFTGSNRGSVIMPIKLPSFSDSS